MSMQWGCPWHGRVEDGQLTLPNGEDMPWPQPPGDTPDDAGFTLHVRMPDVPPVERTDDEHAADQASGMQWLDSAIIAGAGKQEYADTGAAYLHGRPVNGWIYAAPDGSRWIVRGLGRRRMRSANLSITLSLTRFGVLGGRARTYSVSASITAAEQDQAAWSERLNARPEDYRYWQVQDVRGSGDQAIAMIYNAKEKALPLGFVLMTLSGNPGSTLGLSLSKLAGRSDRVTDPVDVDANVASYKGCVSYTLSEDGNYDVTTYGGVTWVPVTEPVPGGAKVFETAHIGSGESRRERTYLIGFWFVGVIPKPVHLRIIDSAVMSYPVPELRVTGKRRTVKVVGSINEYEQVNFSASGSLRASRKIELRFNDSSVSAEYTQDVYGDDEYLLQGGSEGILPNRRPPGSWRETSYNYSIAGANYSRRWSVSARYEMETYMQGVSSFFERLALKNVETFGDRKPYTLDYAVPGGQPSPARPTASAFAFFNAVSAYWSSPSSDEIYVVARRLSNNIMCLQLVSQNSPTSPGYELDKSSRISFRSINPAGLGPERYEESPIRDHLSLQLDHGSYNPITGEAIIGSAEPVSWT